MHIDNLEQVNKLVEQRDIIVFTLTERIPRMKKSLDEHGDADLLLKISGLTRSSNISQLGIEDCFFDMLESLIQTKLTEICKELIDLGIEGV